LPEDVADFLRRRLVELGGLALVLAGAALAAILASYSPEDPSWNTAAGGDAAVVRNLLGVPGAYLADVLVQALGLSAYLIAALLCGWGVASVRNRDGGSHATRLVLGLSSVLLAATALAGLGAGLGAPGSAPVLGGSTGVLLINLLMQAGVAAFGYAHAAMTGLVAAVPALWAMLVSLGIRPGQVLGALRRVTGRARAAADRTVPRRAPGSPAGRADTATSGRLAAMLGGLRGVPAGLASQLASLARRVRPGQPATAPGNRGRVVPGLTPAPAPAPTSGVAPTTPYAAPAPAPSTAPSTAPFLPLRREGAVSTDPAASAAPASDEAPATSTPIFGTILAASRTATGIPHGTPGDTAHLPGQPQGPAAEEGRRSRFAAIIAPKPKVPEAGRAAAPKQTSLALDPVEAGLYELPPLDVLQLPDPMARAAGGLDEEALRQNAALLEGVLEDFGVRGEIVKVSPGPVVTLYELEPAPGTKSSRVIGLADDIARSMSAISVRVAVVPGRNVIGIELPNRKRETVYFRELLETDAFARTQAKLALVLGKDIGGGPVIADLARMPHLLVAGTTGSGKSVAINTMILSLLYRLPPEKCRFIMVDPKMLELSIYEGIPHLLAPVVTDPGKAVVALKWAVREMEDRYRNMSKLGVRNIDGYNARLKEARETGEVLTRRVQTGFDPDTGKPIFEEQPIDLTELPYIVVIVDEMADLMLVAGKDIEAAIQRLAQMARAAGIHLIMATQRPSVDVITGTIKANFPTRISFQVTSKIDSRTILGEQGAEQLLGQGDMLYMAGGGRITRVHGPFVKDEEVELIVRHLKAQGEPMYVDAVTEEEEEFDPEAAESGDSGGTNPATGDDLYDQAVAVVTRERKASTSFIQRHLRIGYNSAARLIERMEKEGVVSRANHAGKREVLARDVEDRERVN
jgi:S-DNA-T family DNA segregation ATPase FtsK/SpoIIIE